MRLSLLALSALCVSSLAAHADTTTITFSGLSGASTSNSTPFTTYTESGYTVSATSGSFLVNNSSFGDPIPSIFTADNSPGGSVQVVNASGDSFNFAGVDLAGYNGSDKFTITGYLSGAEVFQTTGGFTGKFAGYGTGYSSDLVNSVVIGLSGADDNIDNISLDSATSVTPEPSSFVLLGSGLLGVAGVIRRKLA